MTAVAVANPDPVLPVVGDLLLDKYRVEEILGEGGMAVVFGARHELLGEQVAIKVLRPHIAARAEAVARFENEARAASRIKNEHVARVLDVDLLDNGLPAMVIERLEGVDLEVEIAARGRLPVAEAVAYVLQALEAVAQAHASGLVHRDLKPSNLFLAQDLDGTVTVKVLDFGVSKAAPGIHSEDVALTTTRAVLGSPLYMSPEQLRSAKSTDARADVWALGVILYELLTGRLPFEGDTVGEVFAAILEQDPIPPRELCPEIPAELERTILRCITRRDEERIKSVLELAGALVLFAPKHAVLSAQRVRRTLASSKTTRAPRLTVHHPAPRSTSGIRPKPKTTATVMTPPARPSRLPLVAVALGIMFGALVALAAAPSARPVPTEVR